MKRLLPNKRGTVLDTFHVLCRYHAALIYLVFCLLCTDHWTNDMGNCVMKFDGDWPKYETFSNWIQLKTVILLNRNDFTLKFLLIYKKRFEHIAKRRGQRIGTLTLLLAICPNLFLNRPKSHNKIISVEKTTVFLLNLKKMISNDFWCIYRAIINFETMKEKTDEKNLAFQKYHRFDCRWWVIEPLCLWCICSLKNYDICKWFQERN